MFRSKTDAIGEGEFIALAALLISLVSLAIDTMLPALSVIGSDLAVGRANDNQLIISVIFLGMALGQVIYGPLSDSIGRKPAIFIGTGIFIIGCLISVLATSFTLMLLSRLLQGLGIAAPRIVTMALIRDKFAGNDMARIMSFVMTMFILVPVVAPALGQLIISYAHWRFIFVFFILLALIVLIWLAVRQAETLVPEKRRPLSVSRIADAVKEVCANRTALGYTLTSGFLSGLFLAFLSSSPQILQEQYQLGVMFPLYFAILCIAIGLATFLNGKIVLLYGMRLLCHRGLFWFSGFSLLFLYPAYSYDGHPPLWAFMTYMSLAFFSIGIVFGNLNALAMEPLGHIAGVGAAIIASLSTLISLPIGVFIGHSYDGTVMPLVSGFTGCGLSCIALVIWTERTTPTTTG